MSVPAAGKLAVPAGRERITGKLRQPFAGLSGHLADGVDHGLGEGDGQAVGRYHNEFLYRRKRK